MELLWTLTNALTLFYCWLFVRAGSHKLMPGNKAYYQRVMMEYGINPAQRADIAARSVATIELTAGLLIVVPVTRSLGAILCTIVLTAYLALLLTQFLQGKRDMDCGCAGPAGDVKIGVPVLARNALLLLLCIPVLLAAAPVDSAALWLLSLLLGGLVVMLYLSADELIGNAQKLQTLAR